MNQFSNDQTKLVPIYCQQCGRANGVAAKNCIWCGLLIKQGFTQRFDTTRVEIEYLSGIDGIEDPATVRLVISGSGLEISKVLPGNKTFRISAHSLIDARVVDASVLVEGGRGRAPYWWWLVLGPFALLVPGKRKPDITKHDYILSIRYSAAGVVRCAVFHREDRMGGSMVEGLARIVAALVQRTVSNPYTKNAIDG
jgi:hypothetical protein